MYLTDEEKRILDGAEGAGKQKAMEMLYACLLYTSQPFRATSFLIYQDTPSGLFSVAGHSPL